MAMMMMVLMSVLYTSSVSATCPCVAGGLWQYEGSTSFYCANPNGVKTSWCPTAVHPNGTYTSDLPFTFCEGDVLTDCQQALEDNLPTCPCVDGGLWRLKKESQETYSYCADPSKSGFKWCPTKVGGKQEFIGSYKRCTADILESCSRVEAALPAPTCPCLKGGQWTFDGEPQSYCQTPNGIGMTAWCPTTTAAVGTSTLGSFETAYCSGREMKACQKLEGTVTEAECPCVEGGQFQYQGKQYSYCEETSWCATKVDIAGKYAGKYAKCVGEEKAACHELHQLSSQAGKESKFSEFTTANTGCPCWFDMTRSDCACCTDAGLQCGAPMQNYCTSKREGRQKGCPGVPANHWTRSTIGYPCHFNTSRTDCAWCAPGGAQCGHGDKGPDSPGGNRCWDPEDPSYCDSVPGDCLHIDKCDSRATCKFYSKFGKYRQVHQCACDSGWVGNGLQCYNRLTGAPSEEVGGELVEITLAVSSQYYVYPHNSTEFPLGPGEVDLVNDITALFEAGASCEETNGCEGTFTNFVEN